MAITVTVDGVSFVFDFIDQRIDVPATEVKVNVFTLWKAIRTAQGSQVGIAYPVIARASGLDVLDIDEGISTYITVTLFDSWEVNSLLSSGKFSTSGGNLLREDGSDPFRDNPLITYFAFFSQAGTVATVNDGTGTSNFDPNTDMIDGETWTQALTLIRASLNSATDDEAGNAVILSNDGSKPRLTYTYVAGQLDRSLVSVDAT